MTTRRSDPDLPLGADTPDLPTDLTPTDLRCSASSLAAGEAVAGTASTWSACLMVEQDGPWGPKVLTESRLSEPLRRVLGELPVRVLLVRRHGRTAPAAGPDAVTVMASWSSPEGSWLERTQVAHPDDLLDMDLSPLARGESLGWPRDAGPALLVCTHGRRDVCCAERGRPVAAALSARYPEATWECSHVGGHRFAANVVVLPEGLAYGRVEPARATTLAEEWLSGRVVPEQMRGWVSQHPVEQVAETVVRQRLGLVGRDDVRVELLAGVAGGGDEGGDAEVSVEVRAGSHAGRHLVVVRPVRRPDGSEEVLASCGDDEGSPVTDWEVGPLAGTQDAAG